MSTITTDRRSPLSSDAEQKEKVGRDANASFYQSEVPYVSKINTLEPQRYHYTVYAFQYV